MTALVSADIALSKIIIGERQRGLDLHWVDALASNITEIGLQQAIVLLKHKGRYILAAGYHRLEAIRQLGWETIPARIKQARTDNPLFEARLLEIDENLFRRELKGLDRMRSLAVRKEIYLSIYPETRNGAQGGRGGKRNENETFAFSKETAENIGLSRRTVELDIATFNALSKDSVERIDDSDLANKATDIRQIAALLVEEQKQVLDLYFGWSLESRSLVDAINQIKGIAKETEADRTYRSAIGAINRMTPKQQFSVFENYRTEIVAWIKREGLV